MKKIPLWLFAPIGRENAIRMLKNSFQILEPFQNVDIFFGHLPRGLDAEILPPEAEVCFLELNLRSQGDDDSSPESGLRLIREVKKLFPNLMIVVWTNHSEEVRKKALQAGADMEYAKYVNDEKMSEEIYNFLMKSKSL